MQKNSGFSLIELLMVVTLLGIIGGALFGTMASSRLGLSTANEQINRQQEARKVVGRMVNELKISNPNWKGDPNECPIDISSDGKTIDFCIPEIINGKFAKIDESGIITHTVHAVRYKVISDPTSEYDKKLIRKQGSATSVLANDLDIDYLYVDGGKPIFEFDEDSEEIEPGIYSIVNIEVPIIRDERFILSAQVNLRNRATGLTGLEIDEIIEQ